MPDLREAGTSPQDAIESGLNVCVGQCSETGVKPHNQDAVAMRLPSGQPLRTKGLVAALADGLSSAEAGREAAEACVLGFINDYYATPSLWSVPRSAQRVLEALNRWLCRRTLAGEDHLCTLSVLILRSRLAHLFQVGDSRIWRLRDRRLECLTEDHSRQAGGRRLLTRAMGGDTRLEVDYRQCELQQGDIFLLTSDGVHDVLPWPIIEDTLLGSETPQVAAENLVQFALNNGSRDNVSCQVLHVLTLPDASADDALASLRELPLPPPLAPGMRVDGLTVVHELYASARSHLYLVRDADDQLSALKAPSVNLEDDADALTRFALEGWIGARLRSAHLLKPLPPVGQQSCLYQRLEYIDGVTLRQWLREHPDAAVEEKLYLADQLLNGVRALHRADVIHGDLKPDNIMVDRSGLVKLIDFGSCYCRGLDQQPPPLPLGTRHYTARHIRSGATPDEQGDLYAVAVIIHEMLTGTLPDPDKPALRLQQHNAFVPMWLNHVLQRALHPDANPYADAAEFRAALRRPAAHTAIITRQERNTLRLWQATSVILLVLLIMSLSLHL
ncbi:bifunctional protein-serine/threonine kinase/phosphatase [Alcanivorax sp. JB21]|nr:bifunctional protein-serine/threonine kinase/phosphatase [Alcanivorax limicola]